MKQKERIAKKLQTHHPRETMDVHDIELFKLSTIKSQQHLTALENTEILEEELSNEGDVTDEQKGMYLYHVICMSYLLCLDYSGEELSESSEEDEQQKFDHNSTENPLIVTLDPEGLALGALLKKSKKSKEDLIENCYNRWTNNDDNLPDWFVQDEAKHCQKQLPVTKEMVKEFKARLKEINARLIKKIIEAKARKKRRTLKRLEKIDHFVQIWPHK